MNCLSTMSKMQIAPIPLVLVSVPDLAWYKLNDDILDYSNDNVGKVVGTVAGSGPLYTAYLSRKAYLFNGSGNYISLPLLTRSPTMSFSCFVNMSATTRYMRVFDFGGSFRLVLNSSSQFVFNDVTIIPCTSTVLNTWKHIAFTVNNLQFIGYENGAPKLAKILTTNVPSNTSVGYIGHSVSSGDPELSGIISDFRIYNKVLSDSEMFSIFQNNTT